MTVNFTRPRPGRMTLGLLIGLILGMTLGIAFGHRPQSVRRGPDLGVGMDDQEAEQQIRRLYELEHQHRKSGNVAGLNSILHDDYVVTDPFHTHANKQQVLDHVKAQPIAINDYQRDFDQFRRYGDTVVVVGMETIITRDGQDPAAAQQTLRHRFTEVWVAREDGWQKVARHASLHAQL
ncbi:MAG: nuclear transport factor 2 family protein [Pirellulales bacterium]